MNLGLEMSHVPNRPWWMRMRQNRNAALFHLQRHMWLYMYDEGIWYLHFSSISFSTVSQSFPPILTPLPLSLLLPYICTHFFIPARRVSHPGADEREGQDHPWATGLPVSEEGGGEAVLSLLQAFNHLHQGFGGKASSHQGGSALLLSWQPRHFLFQTSQSLPLCKALNLWAKLNVLTKRRWKLRG